MGAWRLTVPLVALIGLELFLFGAWLAAVAEQVRSLDLLAEIPDSQIAPKVAWIEVGATTTLVVAGILATWPLAIRARKRFVNRDAKPS